ncbi:EGF-like calcium-binding, conserved site [Sergentomyia squamirostris]
MKSKVVSVSCLELLIMQNYADCHAVNVPRSRPRQGAGGGEGGHASGQHYDCERPPTVEHASSRLSVDENEDAVSARYTCEPGFELRGEPDVFCDLDTDEWEGQLPSCHKADNAAASAETGAADHQQQPKKQHHNVPEETTIDDDLASRLDLSCMGGQGAAKPPNIENAYVVKFNRRRKGDKVFLVAFYDCEESYELKNPLVDRLYCSQQSWIGDKPQCIFVEDGENGEEEDDYNENVYEDEISQEVHPNGVIHPEERENGEVEEEEEYHEEDYEENSQEVPELPPPAPVTPAPTTAPPPQTTTAFDPNCGPDRGGCDHECRRVLSDHGESHTECSCFTGYELNVRDGRTCNDIIGFLLSPTFSLSSAKLLLTVDGAHFVGVK